MTADPGHFLPTYWQVARGTLASDIDEPTFLELKIEKISAKFVG